MIINKISIQGYKSIKSLELELKPINILLGANGVGKSNFISIFSLVKHLYHQNFQHYIQTKGGSESLLHFGKKTTKNIDLKLFFENGNLFHIDLNQGQESLFIHEINTGYQHNEKWYIQNCERNVSESNFKDDNSGQAFYVNHLLKEFEVYHFHDTSDTSPMKGLSDLNDNHYLKKDGSNLAAFLYYLKIKEAKSFKRIEMMIRTIAPFFDHFDLSPNRLNEHKIQLEWKEKGAPDHYFNAYHLSDGTLRFICLATLLMQPNLPSTIIIDEPELGLHPVAINKLAGMIKKASVKTQLIISTQSTNLIDNFEPEDIIVTDRDLNEKTSVFRRLESKELQGWLEEYTLSDLWGKNKFGAQTYRI